MLSPALEEMIKALRRLPGVGPKSAQRMAFHLLARDRVGGRLLGEQLQHAMATIKHCQTCRTFCEYDQCRLCNNSRRDQNILCIVETPADQLIIERTGFTGLYFVLHGHISPLDGIGPEELGLTELGRRLRQQPVTEIILATNPTVEGEATAHYITQLVRSLAIRCTKIAHGVPMGSELDYLDPTTVSLALAERKLTAID